ncbi:adenylate kinase 8 isoform X1 [Microcaecilia unicolor]|uniref:Adenylate kinase 8 isoform X1 n=1 Tax=Microcaecilia unicolor TaxID=1415580 RepID=A0A6P7YGH9_9AMPH|nr:adenylate kinase 8 isoform X1 [Microcaecilia unicolor]
MDATARPLRIPPEMGVYAEKQKVFELIQKMLERLLIDRPEDPIEYLIDHLKNNNDEVPRIILLGPLVSGKRTLAKMLCKQLNCMHLTLENLLSNDSSLLVDEAHRYKNKDQEIPSALWAKVIQERLSKVECIKKGWVIEAYPKTRHQALMLQMTGIIPEHVVILDAPDSVLLERNPGKRIDPTNGERYHTAFHWPTDPEVQQRLVVPEGATEEEAGKRLLDYHRNLPEILNTYSKIFKMINVDQPCIDAFAQVLTFVQSRHRNLAPHTPRILLQGPPGSGKSLQAELVAQKYNIVNIGCGQKLKEAVADKTKLGELIRPYIENEQQVPDSIVIKILTEHLSKLDSSTRGWVLHGFPRDVEQANMLNNLGFVPNRVFFLDIPDDIVFERLGLRMTDPVTGERYHGMYKPASSLKVQLRLKQNPKHSEKKLQLLLDIYHANVQDLENFYEGFIHINADQDPHTVFELIESYTIKPLPKPVLQTSY